MVTFILWGYVLLTWNLCRTAEVALKKAIIMKKKEQLKDSICIITWTAVRWADFKSNMKVVYVHVLDWHIHKIWVKFVQIPDHTGNWIFWLLASLHYIWLNLIITTCIFKDSVLWIFLNCHFRQYSWSQQNHPHHSETPINGPQNS